MFEAIERLKQEYTDKHVVVIGDRPELARFVGYTGQIKTVNMNGRALVQFDAWSNIGWYDIALDFLRVVSAPESAAAPSADAPAGRVSPLAESVAKKPAKAAATSAAELPAAESAPKESTTAKADSAARADEDDIPTVTHESGPEAPDVE